MNIVIRGNGRFYFIKMHKFKVYLSGPITGLTYSDSISWTDYARKSLAVSYIDNDTGFLVPYKDRHPNNIDVDTGIEGYRPLRGKEHLDTNKVLSASLHGKHGLATNKAIVSRDSYDVLSCDVMLVNLLGAKEKSIGTVSEIAWAWLSRKPIVLVMEDSGNCHEHGFILEMCGHQTTDLDEGINIVKKILLPD